MLKLTISAEETKLYNHAIHLRNKYQEKSNDYVMSSIIHDDLSKYKMYSKITSVDKFRIMYTVITWFGECTDWVLDNIDLYTFCEMEMYLDVLQNSVEYYNYTGFSHLVDNEVIENIDSKSPACIDSHVNDDYLTKGNRLKLVKEGDTSFLCFDCDDIDTGDTVVNNDDSTKICLVANVNINECTSSVVTSSSEIAIIDLSNLDFKFINNIIYDIQSLCDDLDIFQLNCLTDYDLENNVYYLNNIELKKIYYEVVVYANSVYILRLNA